MVGEQGGWSKMMYEQGIGTLLALGFLPPLEVISPVGMIGYTVAGRGESDRGDR